MWMKHLGRIKYIFIHQMGQKNNRKILLLIEEIQTPCFNYAGTNYALYF